MRREMEDPKAAQRALGEAIRSARQRKQVSVEALAKAAEIDVEVLDALEAGQCQPGLSNLFRIALALEEHPESLFESAREHHAVARLVTHADVLFGLYKVLRRDIA